MNMKSTHLLIKSAVCIALVALVGFGLVACKPRVAESKPADVDYYTCTMHPSVHSAVPGKCPICSMELVPVLKREVRTNAMNGMGTNENIESGRPTEFTVSAKRLQRQ